MVTEAALCELIMRLIDTNEIQAKTEEFLEERPEATDEIDYRYC